MPLYEKPHDMAFLVWSSQVVSLNKWGDTEPFHGHFESFIPICCHYIRELVCQFWCSNTQQLFMFKYLHSQNGFINDVLIMKILNGPHFRFKSPQFRIKGSEFTLIYCIIPIRPKNHVLFGEKSCWIRPNYDIFQASIKGTSRCVVGICVCIDHWSCCCCTQLLLFCRFNLIYVYLNIISHILSSLYM